MPLAFWRQLGKSFSCYYSGNFETGFKHGYVQKIYASIRQSVASSGAEPIAVVPTRQVQLKPANPLRQAAAELADAIVARRIQEFSGRATQRLHRQGLCYPSLHQRIPCRVGWRLWLLQLLGRKRTVCGEGNRAGAWGGGTSPRSAGLDADRPICTGFYAASTADSSASG